MTQKITITSIEPKKSTGGKDYFLITDTNGAKMACWDESFASVEPGATIDADLEVKGKFTNIKAFTVGKATPISAPVSPPSASPQPSLSLWSAEQNNSEVNKRKAYEGLQALIVAGRDGPGDIAHFRTLTYEMLGIQPPPRPMPEVAEAKRVSAEALVQMSTDIGGDKLLRERVKRDYSCKPEELSVPDAIELMRQIRLEKGKLV